MLASLVDSGMQATAMSDEPRPMTNVMIRRTGRLTVRGGGSGANLPEVLNPSDQRRVTHNHRTSLGPRVNRGSATPEKAN